MISPTFIRLVNARLAGVVKASDASRVIAVKLVELRNKAVAPAEEVNQAAEIVVYLVRFLSLMDLDIDRIFQRAWDIAKGKK